MHAPDSVSFDPVDLELPLLRIFMSERTGLLSVNLNDFLASVGSASLTNTVCKVILAAFRALNHTGHIQLPYIGTSFISSCFRNFSLRYCHLPYTPL